MTESAMPLPDPAEAASATRMCRTSVLAAMFALPLCCPPMSLLAAATGVLALRQIRRDASLHGRGLAWAAVLVGSLSASIFSWLLWTNGLDTLWRGPNPPIGALMRADAPAMARHWSGPGAALPAEALRAFAEPLEAAHGRFLEARNSATRLASLQQDGRDPVVTVPITMVFERGTVEADLGLERFDPRGGGVVMKWRSLRVLDPALRETVFPPGEPGPAPLAPPATGPAGGRAPATPAPLR